MRKLVSWLSEHPTALYLFATASVVLAYFWHLGRIPLWADEPTRAIVALEMIVSGDWIVPTIEGNYYYNKPPLFNWLVLGLMQLTGSTSEIMVRLPAVVPLFLYGGTIYWWVKKHLDARTGFFAAAAFVACGRLALYDSWLGHIDIFFGWLVFLTFIVIYEGSQKQRWYWLFALAYLLTAIGVLTKVISPVFLGLTLLSWFIAEKRFTKLFHLGHFIGAAILLLIVGGYFWLYNERHPFESFLEGFLNNNTGRTAIETGWGETILSAFAFPFEHLYHLAPWSVFVLFLFKKGQWKRIWHHPFLRFCMLTLLVNLLPYLFSPGTEPRYLFMLYPLALIIIGHGFFANREAMPKVWRGVRIFFLSLFGLMVVAAWGLPLVELPAPVPHVWAKAALLSVGALIVGGLYWKLKPHGYVMIVLAIALVRFAWNFAGIPDRATNGYRASAKVEIAKVLELTEGYPVHAFVTTGLNHEHVYYLTVGKQAIYTTKHELEPNRFYLTHERTLTDEAEIIYSFRQRHLDRMVYLIRKRDQ